MSAPARYRWEAVPLYSAQTDGGAEVREGPSMPFNGGSIGGGMPSDGKANTSRIGNNEAVFKMRLSTIRESGIAPIETWL